MRGSVVRNVVGSLIVVTMAAHAYAELDLPTPLSHYEDFDEQQEAQRLLLQLAVKMPEETRAKAMGLFQKAQSGEAVDIDVEEARALLESADWRAWRPDLLRLVLHRSQVLDVIPEAAEKYRPVIHDSLLLFLDGLSDERLLERVVGQLNLPKETDRGERVLAFIHKVPSLYKLAQILARNPTIEADFRDALKTVENGLETAQYEEIMEILDSEVGEDLRAEYQLRFADELLAEASVGAVLQASFRDADSDGEGRAACKVLKPYAVSALHEDLTIIDTILAFLEENSEFYGLGAAPLVDIFKEIREALAREVRIEDERANLVRAGEYYASESRVVVPELYPFSTTNVTCMEFIAGTKITDAFEGRPEDRATLARRLSDALTYDVIFSRNDVALFHGDPHAGNVFHVHGGADDPYKIALIDWGLSGSFEQEERAGLVQLLLGLYLKHPKRLANNVWVLVDWEPEGDEDRARMRERVEAVVAEGEGKGMFELLDALIIRLATDGYPVRYNAAIFIKSQLTISGILKELDPEFAQDDYVMGRIGGQVTRELHTRLLRTVWFPAWNSHSYDSMMSNEDVKDVQFQRIGRGFKAFGRGVWSGVTFGWLRGGDDDES